MTNSDPDCSKPLIVGFGVTGRAVAAALLDRGHRATVVDDRLDDAGVQLASELGLDLLVAPSDTEIAEQIHNASVLLPTPGLPDHHRAIVAARNAGLPIRSEFDLARLWDNRPLVAITGTNGKTTVTMLVTEALNRSGVKAAAVGNTEVPLVEALGDQTIDCFVVEASSFRLGHTGCFSPRVATWLNLAPDHLDNHGTVDEYIHAKAALWRDLLPDSVVIGNAEDEIVMAHVPASDDRPLDIETFGLNTGTWRVDHGHLVGPQGAVVAITDLPRRQPHDLANAAAVAATAHAAGASLEAIAATLIAFEGFEHRVQRVGTWNDITWYDDSKATVPHATLAAVGGFDSVVLIAGGRNKGLDLAPLAQSVPPVKAVVAIGDATEEVRTVFSRLVEVRTAASMRDAIEAANDLASPGDAVLLSPSCTSFDWYPNYNARGRDFSALVNERFSP